MKQRKVLWQPSPTFIKQSNLHVYRQWLAKNKELQFEDYEELWKWSCEHYQDFWASICQFFELDFMAQDQIVLDGNMPPHNEWFKGAYLNYAEHLFKYENPSQIAIISAHESGKIKEVSWLELRKKVSAFQQKLVKLGVKKGDRVAAVLPNVVEATVAFIATTSLGAIWSCCSPDFGAETILDRFKQIRPKILLVTDGYWYNGKTYERLSVARSLMENLSSVEHTILFSYLDIDSQLEAAHKWPQDILDDYEMIFEKVPFSHPLWVLYSSGTTGKPKAITHSHGGMLLEHVKYLSFHNDVHQGEHFFWFSTTGWMMWNFLQASMLVGAIPVLYDGSPTAENMGVLWRLAEQLPIHHFGTSAPYLTALMQRNISPIVSHELSSLRSIGSTGAPLPPETFDWIYSNIGAHIWLCSMSGGTDVCTAFVGGCPEKPVHSGYIQCRALGCNLKAYNESGLEVYGELGEMVIETPMPCMPIYFWNDENHARFQSSYFEYYEKKWRHGDFIEIEKDGSLIIKGRSDATLNRNGVRIGTAEIYQALNELPFIEDALIINVEKENSKDYMPLFIKVKEHEEISDLHIVIINEKLRTRCSPRHVPDEVIVVADIPYTLSGKKMEVPVKRLFLNPAYYAKIDLGAIRNPDAISDFHKLAMDNKDL